jgi:hypothetical protein
MQDVFDELQSNQANTHSAQSIHSAMSKFNTYQPVMANVLIKGWGGCAESYVYKYLRSRGLTLNDEKDMDGRKHAPRAEHEACPPIPALYVVCNPELSIQSHFRRGWAKAQAQKTTGLEYRDREFPHNISAYMKSFGLDSSISDKAYDWFGFEANMNSWLECPTVLPLTLELAAQHKQRVARHIGEAADFFDGIEIKSRASHELEDTPGTREFHRYYAGLWLRSQLKMRRYFDEQ